MALRTGAYLANRARQKSMPAMARAPINRATKRLGAGARGAAGACSVANDGGTNSGYVSDGDQSPVRIPSAMGRLGRRRVHRHRWRRSYM
jgi:hypothetical protein